MWGVLGWIAAAVLFVVGVGCVIYGLPPGRRHRAARRERARLRALGATAADGDESASEKS